MHCLVTCRNCVAADDRADSKSRLPGHPNLAIDLIIEVTAGSQVSKLRLHSSIVGVPAMVETKAEARNPSPSDPGKKGNVSQAARTSHEPSAASGHSVGVNGLSANPVLPIVGVFLH